jgi:pilus assembly protein CpaE
VAVHTTADPDAILSAMRAGVNEYVYPPLEGALRGALERRSSDAGRRLSGTRWGGRTMGFLSSKGGCGATTIVCHLAVELGRLSQKVLLADLDLDAGLIGFLTKAKPGYSILDAVNNLHRMDVSYWKALVSNGIPNVEVIAAPALAADRTYPQQEQLRQLFSFLRSCYDFTLIDLGRSLTRAGAASLEEMDEAYLVTTLEVPALHQAKQVLQILMDAGYGKDRVKLILNRVPKRSELAPGEIEKIMGLPVYAVLPSCYPELQECYSMGKLLPERSVLGQAIRDLSLRIVGVDKKPAKKKFSLFG